MAARNASFVLVVSLSLALVLALLWALSGFPARAEPAGGVLCVSSGGSGCDPLTCGGCYAAIQDAVDAAASGDEVRVAAGTYDQVNGRGGLAQVVYVDQSISLRGGYSTANWSIPRPDLNPTAIDAGGGGRGIYIAGGVSATVDGFIVTGGDADGVGDSNGSGIAVYGSTVTVRECEITGNRTGDNDDGGGIYAEAATVSVLDSVIRDNHCGLDGGGICFLNTSGTIDGNVIENNVSDKDGGGVILMRRSGSGVSSSVIVSNNDIISNTADDNGGGLYVSSVDVTVRDNHILSNTATTANGGGGWFYALQSVALTVEGNTVMGNRTLDGPGGAFYIGGSYIDAFFYENSFRQNTSRFGYMINSSIDGLALVRNVILDNVGGVSFGEGENCYMANNLVVGNRAPSAGVRSDAIEVTAGSLRMDHNTIVGNSGPAGKAIVVANWDATLSGSNNVIAGHAGTAIHAEDTSVSVELDATVWGTGPWANGQDWSGPGTIDVGAINLWVDPGFVDGDGGDYHLAPSSAAIDAGVEVGVGEDIDGDDRPNYAAPDIGWDEYYGLAVTKSVRAAGTLLVGDRVTYTLRVTNEHPSLAMTGVVVTDSLPVGVAFVSADPPEDDGPDPLRWQVGALNPGDTWTASVVVVVDGSADPIGGNVAGVASAERGTVATEPVLPPEGGYLGGLDIEKVAVDVNGAPLYPGDWVRYEITVTNQTTAAVVGVVVTDVVPSGVSFVAASPGEYTGTTSLVWDVGSLGAGVTWTAAITVEVVEEVTIIDGNVAWVASDAQGARTTAPILPPGGGEVERGLDIEKAAADANGGPLYSGDEIVYQITVTNGSEVYSHTGILITDSVPEGTSFLPGSVTCTTGAMCGEAGGVISATIDLLNPGEAVTLTFQVTVDEDAEVIGENVAWVESREEHIQGSEETLPSGPGGEAGTGEVARGLLIDKTAQADDPLLPGDEITYSIIVTNANLTFSQRGVFISDTAPASTTMVPGSARCSSDATCGEGGGVVSATIDLLTPGKVLTLTFRVAVDEDAEVIGGNVAWVVSQEQNEQPTDPILPPGGETVGGGVCYLPIILHNYPFLHPIDDAPEACPGLEIEVGDAHRYLDNFDRSNDNDWYTFVAQEGQTYVLRTFDLDVRADTVLYLYDGDCETLLAENDDVAVGDPASRIDWTAPAGKTVHVLVRSYDWQVYGAETGYTFNVVVED